jgi:hypothetical protein
MPAPDRDRIAYHIALQFQQLAVRIVDEIRPTHRRLARELEEYTNEMLSCLRRSNNCVGTEQGRQESVQAAVWMVDALIVLTKLHDNHVERALVTASIEVLERVETELRVEGSLPPALDPP